jgi:hypothetical protein
MNIRNVITRGIDMKSLSEAAKRISGDVKPKSVVSLAHILNISRPISVTTICNETENYGKYIFKLDNFKVVNARSKISDKDFITFNLQVGSNQPVTATTMVDNAYNIDNDPNGYTYIINLALDPIIISDPNTSIVFNYLIVNAGHGKDDETWKQINQAADILLKSSGKILETGVGGIWGAIIGGVLDLAALGIDIGFGFLTTSCDGKVALDQVTVTGTKLNSWFSNSNSYSETRYYRGEYVNGEICGHSSEYYVTWSCSKI